MTSDRALGSNSVSPMLGMQSRDVQHPPPLPGKWEPSHGGEGGECNQVGQESWEQFRAM